MKRWNGKWMEQLAASSKASHRRVLPELFQFSGITVLNDLRKKDSSIDIVKKKVVTMVSR